jgi:hypothetical protein
MIQAASRLPALHNGEALIGPKSILLGFVVNELALEHVRPRVQTVSLLCNFILRNFKLENVFKKLDNSTSEARTEAFLRGINPLKTLTNLRYIV